MRYIRIILFIIIAVVVLYIPFSMIWGTLKDAPNQENTERAQQQTAQEEAVPVASAQMNTKEGYDLAPTVHTPENYTLVPYDPFYNKFDPTNEKARSFQEEIRTQMNVGNAAPIADFTVQTGQGIEDRHSGTTTTAFRFSASPSSDTETDNSKLRVRWDFESDGEWDTYFSRTKRTEHTYHQPGRYDVTLEVLDEQGRTAQTTQLVTVVENTPPSGAFTFSPTNGTTGQIFTFDTRDSRDGQYRVSNLEYRFDWENDGQWDTAFQSKNVWKHRFDAPGDYHILMETRDPEGATSLSEGFIQVRPNSYPIAHFTVSNKNGGSVQNFTDIQYAFDASKSVDPDGGELRYRWDFDYKGDNDIAFSTGWMRTERYTGEYNSAGSKIIRLQVQDRDGAISETFAAIVVQ